jgi:hypothetical protein
MILGVYCSLFLLLWIGNKAVTAIYDTWLGVLLGHNVNLRKMGKWAVVTGGKFFLTSIKVWNIRSKED